MYSAKSLNIPIICMWKSLSAIAMVCYLSEGHWRVFKTWTDPIDIKAYQATRVAAFYTKQFLPSHP